MRNTETVLTMNPRVKKLIPFVALLLVIVVIAGFFLVFKKPIEVSGDTIQRGEVVVKMTEDGYIPNIFKIKKGTKVRFQNVDSYGHWPASDLHPTHTIYPEFDPKRVVKAKEEWSFIFDKVGVWTMHDHLSPYITGKITVVD